jgi:hypothetical protein
MATVVYSIVTGQVASDDPIYAAIDPADVRITNADDDEAGITVSGVGILFTTEAGGTRELHRGLKSQPTADVVIAVASSDLTEGHGQRPSLTFTAADWNVPQTVTVTGVDDLVDDDGQRLHRSTSAGGHAATRTTPRSLPATCGP